MGNPLGEVATDTAATFVFIGGGLPHGAYDIALLQRAITLDRHELLLAVGGYGAIAAVMAILWMASPLVALMLFLAVAAVHFGEDWEMLDEPLLRLAAGVAIIAAPTIGHHAAVSAVFVEMSDERAAVIVQLIVAAAPVALLVTAVGIVVAWLDGSRRWAAAMALCLILLTALPPVVGFALFFVFLHSPRHLAQARGALRDMASARWVWTGVFIAGIAIAGWCLLQQLAPSPTSLTVAAQGFQLLASVAVPHLLLSRWLDERLNRSDATRRLRFSGETSTS
ncbi:MAG: Brp/Blh family beta-carotene 15,15'-dioxygenase [Sphingomonas sp.]